MNSKCNYRILGWTAAPAATVLLYDEIECFENLSTEFHIRKQGPERRSVVKLKKTDASWSDLKSLLCITFLVSAGVCCLILRLHEWGVDWRRPSVRKKRDKPITKHCFQTVYSLSTLPWYIVCTLLRPREQFSTHKEHGMQASPSAPITEIYYSCLCTVLLVLTPCSVFTHQESSAFTHNSAPLWPISQQRFLSYSREHVRVSSQLSIVKPQGFKIFTWTEKRTKVGIDHSVW